MTHDISFIDLDANLMDINREDLIPENVMKSFWKIKAEKGSLPMGVSFIEGKGWYIVSNAVWENEGILDFIPIE